jgi:hypothetical protein
MAELDDVPEARFRAAGSIQAVVLLALAVLLFPRISAAHVAPVSVSELAAVAPHVVVATVEGKASRWNAQHTLLVTDYTLRIEEHLRGAAADRAVITVPGGTLGDLTDDTCVSVHLEPGARYLLFLGELDRPSFTPILGAGQGMFREVPGGFGSFAAAGESREPIVRDGKPVRFADFVAAVRPLAAKALAAPRPPRPEDPTLPAKRWDAAARPSSLTVAPLDLPETSLAAPPLPGKDAPGIVAVAAEAPLRPKPAKYQYFELAKPPIIVNPLPPDSAFAPWDQQAMAYWNRYAGDLYRVTATPTSTWAFGNGISDIAGFPDTLTMLQQFGNGWYEIGSAVLAVTFTHKQNGVLLEADVAFNPSWTWTTDELAGMGHNHLYPFQEVALHELGHVWGLKHAWQYQQVWWDSVMNYKSKLYYEEELFADDTAAVRAAFPPGVALRDGLISSYTTYYDDFEQGPEYTSVHPSVSTVRTGGSFGLTSNIKLENTGTVKLVNPVIEVYLTPAQLSFTHAVLIKRVQVRGTVPVGATQQVNVGPLRVPTSAKAGTYFLGFFLRDAKDAYQGNNGAWSDDNVTLTVTKR